MCLFLGHQLSSTASLFFSDIKTESSWYFGWRGGGKKISIDFNSGTKTNKKLRKNWNYFTENRFLPVSILVFFYVTFKKNTLDT